MAESTSSPHRSSPPGRDRSRDRERDRHSARDKRHNRDRPRVSDKEKRHESSRSPSPTYERRSRGKRHSRRRADSDIDSEDSFDSRTDYRESRRHPRRTPDTRKRDSHGHPSSSKTRVLPRRDDCPRADERHDTRPLTEEEGRKRRNQAIKSAVTAGAFEAFRQRNRPGKWVGAKGFRVATAAVSAGLVDAKLDSKPGGSGGLGGGVAARMMQSTVAGILIDKITNAGSTSRK